MHETVSVVSGQPAVAPPRADGSGGEFKPFGEDGLTFADLLDIVNPLQHIPVISTLYRHFTGDVLDPAMRIAGGTLFGGPIGAIVSIFNVILKDASGRDMGEHALALLFDEAPGDGILIAGESEKAPDIAWNQPRPTPRGPAALATADITWNQPRNTPIGPAALATADIAWNQPRNTPIGPAAPATADFAWNQPRPTPTGPAVLATADIAWNGPRRHPGPTPAGATASEGGWFSSTMLTALGRYEDGARLTAERPVHWVNVVN